MCRTFDYVMAKFARSSRTLVYFNLCFLSIFQMVNWRVKRHLATRTVCTRWTGRRGQARGPCRRHSWRARTGSPRSRTGRRWPRSLVSPRVLKQSSWDEAIRRTPWKIERIVKSGRGNKKFLPLRVVGGTTFLSVLNLCGKKTYRYFLKRIVYVRALNTY